MDKVQILTDILSRGNVVVTGIGSRETPPQILDLMTRIGAAIAQRGGQLRSGGAGGADLAFEAGWRDAAACEIFHPWHGFAPKVGNRAVDIENILGRSRPSAGPGSPIVLSGAKLAEAEEMASRFHPAWHRCSPGARKLHSRNIPQVLGADLDRPSALGICWTKDGEASGGTGQAMRVADHHGVPFANLKRDDERRAVIAALGL